jgi:hypothetical protein
MENITIIEQVKQVRDMIKSGSNKDDIKNNFSELANNYPTLFEMVNRTNFNMEEFEYIMNLRKDINDGKETLETASNKISTVFFHKYHPNVK